MKNLYLRGAAFSPFTNWFCFVFECPYEQTAKWDGYINVAL